MTCATSGAETAYRSGAFERGGVKEGDCPDQ